MQHAPQLPPASIRDLRRDRSILALAAALCGALAAAGLGGVLVVHQLCTEHNASHIGEANADLALAIARIDETRGELEQTRRELDDARLALAHRPGEDPATPPCARHGKNHHQPHRGTLAPTPSPTSAAWGAPRPADAPPLTTITHAGIACPSEHHCQIHREVIDAAIANPATLQRSGRALQVVRDGRTHGIKFYGIREGSPLRLLGFKNGDMVTAIDGRPLDSVEVALMTFQRIGRGETRRLEVAIDRRGEALTKTYEIL